MMRRIVCLLLAALLVGLCACTAQPDPTEPLQPFDFYYRAEEADFSSPYGPIGVEPRDLDAAALRIDALISLYLQGPQTEGLLSPFPPNVTLVSVSHSATLLTLTLSSEYALLQGVDASIADACLTKTLLGLANIRRVRILTEAEDGTILRSVLLDGSDILLSDNDTDAETHELTLYFADAEGRYLLSEKRSVSAQTADTLAQEVTELLLGGPQTAGLYPTLPVGTSLLDINVENGICAVDLSAEFLESRTETELPPHLILLSLANTLTELDGVDQVQVYVEGRQSTLGPFPLTAVYTAESRAVGPSHPELSEQDCTLCLPVTGSGLLYRLPLRVRSGSNESAEETLLRVLFSYAPQNSFENPWFGAELPLIHTERGVCTLTFDELPTLGETEQARQLALRTLIATLGAQPEIDRVLLIADGTPLDYTDGAPIPDAPEDIWFGN